MVLLLSFLGVLRTVSGAFEFSICGVSLAIPGYMVWCALLYAASGSWLTWRVGRPLVSINSRRYQRESELQFALFQANQHMQRLASAKHGCGPIRFSGTDDALYERHLPFDDIVAPNAAGPREQFEAAALSARDVLSLP